MSSTDALLFVLQACRAWGDAVAQAAGLEMAGHEERRFEDGEGKTRPLVNVRGRDVYVLQALHGDPGESVHDRLCRLLFFVGALRDASAARITVVVPYLAYARKDRKSQPRDPVATRYVAQLLESVGTDRVLTMDVHNLAAFQNAFRCRTEHLEAAGLLAAHMVPLVAARNAVVVSPDAGGIHRAEQFRRRLEHAIARPVELAFAEKHRALGAVGGRMLAGDVRHRVAIVVDDLVSTGGTLARTARACRDHGATCVYAVATHGIFSPGAPAALADADLAGVVVTDTVGGERLPPGQARERVSVVPTAALFGEAIRRLHAGGSLVELLAHAT